MRPVSDLVQGLLEEVGYKEIHSSTASGERQLSMPLSVLEALAEKVSRKLFRLYYRNTDADNPHFSFLKPSE